MIQAPVHQDDLPDRVSRVIVECFRPRRVVLFGSRARGDARPDSDYDIFVVLDSDSPWETTRAIRAVLQQRGLDAAVHVATPEVYDIRKHDVGTLEFQVERDGRVLFEHHPTEFGSAPRPAPRVREPGRIPPSVEEWLEQADEDLEIARQSLASANPVWSGVCFHAHEAAEKLLKAAIVATNQPPPRIHTLVTLLDRAPKILWTDGAIISMCGKLDEIYESSRYPGGRKLGPADATLAWNAAQTLSDGARRFIDAAR